MEQLVSIPRANQQSHFLGLDLFRATAILLVMFSHYANNVSFWLQYSPHWRTFTSGTIGVDLFFVLSGFLVGKLLLDIIEKSPDFENFFIFLVRRWLRTVPLYYLWLVVLLFMFPKRLDVAWYYVPFMQNFSWPMVGPEYFFSVSWSLTIEEWFYILFGGALIGSAVISSRRVAVGCCLLAFLAIPFILRMTYPGFATPGAGWSQTVVFRLDGIAYGVVMAVLYRRKHWIFLWPKTCLAIGISAILTQWAGLLPLSYWATVCFQPIIFAAGAALCLPAALRLPPPPRSIAWAIRTTSNQAYGLYIIHITILVDVIQPMWWRQEIPVELAIPAAIIIPFVLSYLSYKYFEAPILLRRPSQTFSARGRAAASPVTP